MAPLRKLRRLSLVIVLPFLAVTTGEGWAAGLWVGRSDGSRFTTSQQGYWETYERMKVLAGDFNGDGRTDVMKFDVAAGGAQEQGLWVGLSDGTRFNTTRWATWNTYERMKVLAGDFNGDGMTDVMKFDVAAGGAQEQGLWVGLSDGTKFNTTRWATWNTYERMKVLAGDFNGDGRTDVMKFDVAGGGPQSQGLWVGLSDGTRFNTTQWATAMTYERMKVLTGDFNRDGRTDVMKFDVPSGGPQQLGLWVGLSDGTRFNTTQWATWDTYERMKVLAGDFNGDGRTDVMKFDVPSGVAQQLGLWVGLSDGTRFNTTQWATWDTYERMKVLAGDFNKDRRADVMKFDVPAPQSAESRCRDRGGVWIGWGIDHCSQALAVAYRTFMNVVNPLVWAYDAYFAVVGSNANMERLPEYVVQRLSGHFTETMLRRVRYGASHHTSSDNTAMTDCDKIYFPSGRGHVEAIRNGGVFDRDRGRFVNEGRVRLLLHELTHVQQCIAWGGRENYATTWFAELTATTIEQLVTNPGNVSNRGIHDEMPLETRADENADRILSRL